MPAVDTMLKHYFRPHSLLYVMTGIGIGLLLSWFFGFSKDNAFVLGAILLVCGVFGELLTENGEQKKY